MSCRGLFSWKSPALIFSGEHLTGCAESVYCTHCPFGHFLFTQRVLEEYFGGQGFLTILYASPHKAIAFRGDRAGIVWCDSRTV